jgi:hypothetical protein
MLFLWRRTSSYRLLAVLAGVLMVAGSCSRADRDRGKAFRDAIHIGDTPDPKHPLYGVIHPLSREPPLWAGADPFPLDQIGALWYQDVGQPPRAHCTCFKASNAFTCVSAAHCFVQCEGPDSPAWRRLPRITFRAYLGDAETIDEDSYGVVVPAAYYDACKDGDLMRMLNDDIAVIRFGGKWAPSQDVADSNIYNGNANPMVDIDRKSTNRYIDIYRGPTLFDGSVEGYPAIPLRQGPAPGLWPSDWYTEHTSPTDWSYPALAVDPNGGPVSLLAGNPNILFYYVSTAEGMSGGPILPAHPGAPATVAGVHHGSMPGQVYNVGVSFTAARIAWIALVGGYKN